MYGTGICPERRDEDNVVFIGGVYIKFLVTRAIDAGYKYSRDAQLLIISVLAVIYTSPKRPLWIMNPVSFCVMESTESVNTERICMVPEYAQNEEMRIM